MIKWLRRLAHGTRHGEEADVAESGDEALLIRIFADTLQALDDPVADLAILEDDLQNLLGDVCEVDGHDIGPDDATIYIYGPSAESMFEVLVPYLVDNALTARAQAILRFGPPESQSRTVQLPQ